MKSTMLSTLEWALFETLFSKRPLFSYYFNKIGGLLKTVKANHFIGFTIICFVRSRTKKTALIFKKKAITLCCVRKNAIKG